MEKQYILTSSGNFISTDELYHWGIKGMKWGIRRYQNKGGSLSAGGKKKVPSDIEDEQLNRRKRVGEALSKISGKNETEITEDDKKCFESDIRTVLTQTTPDRISSKNTDDVKETGRFVSDCWKYDISDTTNPDNKIAKRYYDTYVKTDVNAYAKSIIEEIECRELQHSDIVSDELSEDELFHYGTRGMKWGIRRYQNKDGSLTAAGRKRYTNTDGTLNEKGKQYVAKERAKLKAAQTTADNLKKTNAKFDRLDAMRNKVNGTDKKATDNTPDVPKKKSTSEMTDKELQDKVNRLRNEDAYNDLSKKLGYDGPKTELDYKIAEMKKQKEYLELQRDINNLTPKHVSKGKQIMDAVLNKVIAPAATEAGKKFLTNYLSEAGQQAIKNKFSEKAKDAQKSAEKVEEKINKKEAKKQAKADAKAEAEARKKVQEAYEDYLRGGSNKQDSTYSKKGGDREYVNPNQERGLTLYNPNMSSSTMAAVNNTVNKHSSSSVTSLVTKSNVSKGKTNISGLLEGPVRDDGKFMSYDDDGNFLGYWSDIRGDSDGII